MATGSPFMGTLKGKLGETVALRRNGKQVLRAYVRDIKNPNSQKQQVQRMVQATAAQAYSAMKTICNHSFEGVQVGQKSMSYFISKNMDKLRAAITAGVDGTLVSASADYVRKGVNLPVLNKYIVAKGTLPEVSIYDNPFTLYSDFNADFVLGLLESGYNEPAQVVQHFIEENNGILGDWFTFLLILRENGSIQSGQQTYRFAFVRFVVDKVTESETEYKVLTPSLTSIGSTDLAYDDVILRLSDVSVDPPIWGINFANILPNLGSGAGKQTICAYAVIHSRQNVGGAWQRSNAEFVIRDNWEALNITFPGDFFAELATYAGSAEAKGLGDYVLNGGD